MKNRKRYSSFRRSTFPAMTGVLSRRRSRRPLSAESLERKDLLTAAPLWSHNAALPSDVNADGQVSPIDALLVINQLNLDSLNVEVAQAGSGNDASGMHLDVSNDSQLSPIDALLVINWLNRAAEGEEPFAIRVRLETIDIGTGELLQKVGYTQDSPETFGLRAWVQDLSGSSEGGVRSAYFDLVWNLDIVSQSDPIEFGSRFPNGQSGTLDGLSFDEIGGADGVNPSGPGEVLLFTIPFTPTGTGELDFDMNAAEEAGHVFELYNVIGPVDAADVEFFGATVIVAQGVRPLAVNDQYTAIQNAPLSINSAFGLLANDVDPDSDVLEIKIMRGPESGQLQVGTDGSFVYTPASDFTGQVSFEYRLTDATFTSLLATVTIDVAEATAVPVAMDDFYETSEDSILDVTVAQGLLANDTDPESDPLTVSVVEGPTRGELSINSDGSFNYVPNEDFFGTDTFTYVANDGTQNSLPATVTISVTPVNDRPVAQADGYLVVQDEQLVVTADKGVLANDTDVDSSNLTAEMVDQPSNGTVMFSADGSFTYTPAIGFAGLDGFTYRTGDGELFSDPQQVVIEVVEPPLVELQLMPVDVTNSVITTITQGGQFFLRGTIVDLRAGDLAQGVFSAYADVLFDSDLVTVAGAIQFGTSYPNGHSGSVTAPGLMDEIGGLDGLAPLGSQPRVLFRIPFLANEIGTALFSSDPAEGATREVLLFGESQAVPDARVRFGTTQIEIIAGNRPEAGDDEYQTAEDTTLTVSAANGVLNNDSDADDDPLIAVLVDPPAHGEVQLAEDGSFVYTPDPDFFGTDTFTYAASDGTIASNPATVTITVTPLPDVPVAVDDSYQQPEVNAPLVVAAAQGVLANDFDPDGTALTAQLVTPPSVGQLQLNANGGFTYTPPANFLGVVEFTYRAASGGDLSNVATVELEIGNLSAPSTVSGTVFFDVDNDGVRDPVEPGFGGVQIRIVGENVFGESVDRVVQTNRSGQYVISDLLRGTYVVRQSSLAQVIDGKDIWNGEVSPQNDQYQINLLPGVELTGLNFAERGLLPQFITNGMFLSSRDSRGVTVGIDAAGNQSWYCFDQGWNGYREIRIAVQSDGTTVRITATTNSGQVQTTTVSALSTSSVRIQGTAQTGYVVRLKGSSTDFGLGSAVSAPAVDAVFGA